MSDQLGYFDKKGRKTVRIGINSTRFSQIWNLAQCQQEIHVVSFSELISFSEMLTVDFRNDLLKNPKQQNCPERERDIGCFRLNAVKSQAALRVEVIREDLELRVQDFHSRICEDNRKRTSEYFYGSSCFDISTLLKVSI